jgi:toxin CptA
MLWSLAWLGPCSLLASDLPRAVAWPLAACVAGFGLVQAWRHGLAPALALVIPVGRGQATCNGLPMQALDIAWRGPLAFLRWRDPGGRVRRLVFCPDTLPASSRRELRLAGLRMQSARDAASMAR